MAQTLRRKTRGPARHRLATGTPWPRARRPWQAQGPQWFGHRLLLHAPPHARHRTFHAGLAVLAAIPSSRNRRWSAIAWALCATSTTTTVSRCRPVGRRQMTPTTPSGSAISRRPRPTTATFRWESQYRDPRYLAKLEPGPTGLGNGTGPARLAAYALGLGARDPSNGAPVPFARDPQTLPHVGMRRRTTSWATRFHPM